MRAVFQRAYGLDAIELVDRPMPQPGPGQVRLRIEAAALNPADWHLATGSPTFLRLREGLRRPRRQILGSDAAGIVDALGDGVTGFRLGDRVFGEAPGAFAEYALADAGRLVAIPDGMDFDEAAGLPIAGVTALQAVEKGDVAGRRVVVNGAGGGVGTYAVQIAAASGAAEVAGVCSLAKADLVASLGADRVIDYATDDFTLQPADVVIDCVGNRTVADMRRCLAPSGRWVVVGAGKKDGLLGPIPRMLGTMARLALSTVSVTVFVADETGERLAALADLAATGRLRTVIDTRYGIDEIDKAFAHLVGGRTGGKIILHP